VIAIIPEITFMSLDINRLFYVGVMNRQELVKLLKVHTFSYLTFVNVIFASKAVGLHVKSNVVNVSSTLGIYFCFKNWYMLCLKSSSTNAFL
jgi:hypothetical protein